MRRLGVFGALLLIAVGLQAQISFRTIDREMLQKRLAAAPENNADREKMLLDLFQQAGCTSDHLTTEVVKHAKLPNVICTFPGATDEVIIVGAHFDHVDIGRGVVDNWSGASMLPSLLQSLSGEPRRHTFVFIGFTNEEAGLVGSQFYARHLSKEQKVKVEAMVNLDTLGLGPTEVWSSRADKHLLDLLAQTANAMKLPLSGMNVDQVGTSDSQSFEDQKIPAIMLHSVTQKTWPILHSQKDTISAINMDDYDRTYGLVAGYLAVLDSKLGENKAAPQATKAGAK